MSLCAFLTHKDDLHHLQLAFASLVNAEASELGRGARPTFYKRSSFHVSNNPDMNMLYRNESLTIANLYPSVLLAVKLEICSTSRREELSDLEPACPRCQLEKS